jgi:hypothetical protein
MAASISQPARATKEQRDFISGSFGEVVNSQDHFPVYG